MLHSGIGQLSADGSGFTEVWGSPPFNMVKVQIRKTNSDLAADDGKLPLIFAPITGERAHALTADAIAFIESRDIVAVLDYSGSMSFDSIFRQDTINRLGIPQIENNLSDMWDTLVASDVRFSDDISAKKFPAGGFGKIDSDRGTYISSSDTDAIYDALQLGSTSGSTGSGSGSGVKFYDRTKYRRFPYGIGTGDVQPCDHAWQLQSEDRIIQSTVRLQRNVVGPLECQRMEVWAPDEKREIYANELSQRCIVDSRYRAIFFARQTVCSVSTGRKEFFGIKREAV